MRSDTFDEELSEYMVIQQQAKVIERSLLEEHQLMVNPPDGVSTSSCDIRPLCLY